MSRIFDGISAFLREEFKADDWKKDEDGDQTIAFLLEDDNGRQWDGAVLIDEDNHRLVCYSTMLESAKKKGKGKRRKKKSASLELGRSSVAMAF